MDFGSVQVRSRAVLAQEPENLQLCPDQAWESQPCTGQPSPSALISYSSSPHLLATVHSPTAGGREWPRKTSKSGGGRECRMGKKESGGECYEYKWFSSVRLNSTRSTIWCQRSDGLNVTGSSCIAPDLDPPLLADPWGLQLEEGSDA
ncbi:hypothetical protein FQN60_017258 [Etheostoma spectabile]|uniref:Uncharacterized protein n=1 Tax=Etheostoma spectabile TaxID=54343 RepID=A0A5J5DF02_9PERO|nr:hypothetical protein FQN60_017258 [Etheostoma spectabile]